MRLNLLILLLFAGPPIWAQPCDLVIAPTRAERVLRYLKFRVDPAELDYNEWMIWIREQNAKQMPLALGKQTSFGSDQRLQENRSYYPINSFHKTSVGTTYGLQLKETDEPHPEVAAEIRWLRTRLGVRHFQIAYDFYLAPIPGVSDRRFLYTGVSRKKGLEKSGKDNTHRSSVDTVFLPASALRSDVDLLFYLKEIRAEERLENEARIRPFREETREILRDAYDRYGARSFIFTHDVYLGSVSDDQIIELRADLGVNEPGVAAHERVHIQTARDVAEDPSRLHVGRAIEFLSPDALSYLPENYQKGFHFDEVEANLAHVANLLSKGERAEAERFIQRASKFIAAERRICDESLAELRERTYVLRSGPPTNSNLFSLILRRTNGARMRIIDPRDGFVPPEVYFKSVLENRLEELMKLETELQRLSAS